MSNTKSFSLVVLNCWGPPFAKDIKKRMALIAEKILTEKYDILLLIEVFYQESIDFLRKVLEHLFPYSHYYKSGHIGSGIFIISRFPIFHPLFTIYSAGESSLEISGDYYSSKGIAYCQIETPQGRVKLISTHIHCKFYNNDYFVIRHLQIHQLVQYIKSIYDDSIPIIVAGDFNFDRGELGIEYFLSATQTYDSFESIHNEKIKNIFTYIGYNGDVIEEEKGRLDYIMCNKNIKTIDSQLCFDDHKSIQYSDHLGVVSTLCLKSVEIINDDKQLLTEKMLDELSKSKYDPPVPYLMKISILILGILLVFCQLNLICSRKKLYYMIRTITAFHGGITLAFLLTTYIYKVKQHSCHLSVLKDLKLDLKYMKYLEGK